MAARLRLLHELGWASMQARGIVTVNDSITNVAQATEADYTRSPDRRKRTRKRDEHERSNEQHLNEEQPGTQYQHEKDDHFLGCFCRHVCPGRCAPCASRALLKCQLERRVWIFGRSRSPTGGNTFYGHRSLEVRR